MTTTKYDRTDRGYTGFTATYLRNRVAYTTYQQNPNAQVQESHYSYDVHGNVKSMLQVIRGDGEELTKRIDYEYDLVSGKVNKVTYQKDNSDQFIHQYTYDGDNRIIQVATSTDDIVYTKEATYQYYAHGPLARINYGELHVETQDFAYTIQGWIKQVQGQVFAYALGYNNTDYTSIGANASPLPTPIASGKGLYNGNIATMSSKTQVIDAGNPWVQQYTYDQLNRIKTSTTQGNNQYATSYSYDANGNILNLTRKDYKGDALDNLTYNYENKSAGYQRNTNRLRSVDDAAGATSQKDDIEDQQEDNYRYDATGNLVYDRSEEIESIQWTVSGKVLKVIRTSTSTKPNLEFTYDASGNRIAKKVIQPNGDYKTTFYVRDASGNVMAVYKTSGTTNLTLEEQHIYGSSRLGIFKKDKTVPNKARALGERQYELTDHLGNVRAVIIDYKRYDTDIKEFTRSATDYYPFGMVALGRTHAWEMDKYRYGFNGKEVDKDFGGAIYDYGFRIYDARLAKFLSVDPLTKSYPWYTPYQFAGNKPINCIDLDGLEESLVIHHMYKTAGYYLEITGKSSIEIIEGYSNVSCFLEKYNIPMDPYANYATIYIDGDNNTVVSYVTIQHVNWGRKFANFWEKIENFASALWGITWHGDGGRIYGSGGDANSIDGHRKGRARFIIEMNEVFEALEPLGATSNTKNPSKKPTFNGEANDQINTRDRTVDPAVPGGLPDKVDRIDTIPTPNRAPHQKDGAPFGTWDGYFHQIIQTNDFKETKILQEDVILKYKTDTRVGTKTDPVNINEPKFIR